MRQIIFVLFCLFSFTQLLAQRSHYQMVFRITANEAETLYQNQPDQPYIEPFLYNLVDSFQVGVPDLAVGHYLFVYADKENLHIQQHSVHQHDVRSLPDGTYFNLEVLDTNSRTVSDARLSFREKSVPWNSEVQLYRLKRPRKDGWLRVELPGDTLFYQVDYDKVKPKRRAFFRTPLGYVISTPYRWGKNVFHYFKRGIGRGNWRINWRGIWPFRPKSRHFKGYVAMNQPKYRPGDTLKVKAFVTKHNGRPWNKPLELEVRGQRNKLIFREQLAASRPGAYHSELVLADSLKLDQAYTVTFRYPEKRKFGRMSEYFRLEDYQLEAATFDFAVAEKAYHRGQSIYMEASGKDENGNPLPGGQVEVVALRGRVHDIYQDSIYIPDTLWTGFEDLSLREDTRIMFPDSLLPPAKMDVQLQAFFSTAGGESEQRTASFSYQHQDGRIHSRLEAGYWVLEYQDGDSLLQRPATLMTRTLSSPYSQTKTIQLPHRERANGLATIYRVTLADSSATHLFSPASSQPGFDLLGSHQGDSLLLQFVNPHRIPVRYQLYTNKRLIEEGQDSTGFFARRAKPSDQYSLHYQYYWGGKLKKGVKKYRRYKQQLDIAVELPEVIYPGATVPVKITATDHKNRPAKGVDLVAGAINGQFNTLDNITTPRMNYKRKPAPPGKHAYTIRKPGGRHQRGISRSWYERLALDTVLYHQIRHPDQGVFTQYDTLVSDPYYQKFPQISPYVVKNGQLQAVYMVYINRELVYSHLSQDKPPYAFSGRIGKNQIRLRTRDAVYEIEGVVLASGQKLTISVDENTFAKHPYYGTRIKQQGASTQLTRQEEGLLNQRMFRIQKETRTTTSYLMKDSSFIHRWAASGRSTRKVVGPFPPNSKLTYVQKDGTENTFHYEPGFTYEIRENRERLYYQPLFPSGKPSYKLPKSLPHPAVDQLAYTPRDVIRKSPMAKRINYREGWLPALERSGSMQFLYDSKEDSSLVAISLEAAGGALTIKPSNQREFNALQEGYYQISLITRAGYTASRAFWVKPYHRLVLDMRGATFIQDTTQAVFEDLYSFYHKKESFIGEGVRPGPFTLSAVENNPYYENGYLASGVLQDEESGEPLIYASIRLVGTEIGTNTDFDGRWQLWVPGPDAELEFSYTGYTSQRVSAAVTEVSLGGGVALSEVVVTGYSVSLIEQDNTTMGATVTASDIRNLPTRNINALAATSAGLMVDDAGAINIRGSRSNETLYHIDGIRTGGASLDATSPFPLLLEGKGLRTTFRDYGFWRPLLLTDKEGVAYTTVTFPDDITAWKTYVMGQDKRARVGVWYGETKAYQPVLAQLYLPRFLLPGDEVDLVGSVVNYTRDSFAIQTSMEIEDQSVLTADHQLVDEVVEAVAYTAPTDVDSVQVRYQMRMPDYEDGEQRDIPLFPVGTEETLGAFHLLEGDTSLSLTFDPAAGPVTIYAQEDLLGILLRETDALINYPYGCNEQTASGLMALLMHKKIKELKGEPFELEKEIIKRVARLRQQQNPDGSWGWWSAGTGYNRWMTIYVVRALQQASEAGYTTEALEKGLLLLTNELPNLAGRDHLETLSLLSEIGQNMDYADLLTPYDSLQGINWTTLTATRIRVEQGLPYQLDTLNKYQEETLFGGQYWGETGYGFYHNDIQYSLLAYRILREAGQKERLKAVRQFFLEKQYEGPGYYRRAAYRNTFEAATILSTLLPDILEEYAGRPRADFDQQLVLEAGSTIRWDSFPQKLKLAGVDRLRLEKSGMGQVYLTAYQQKWNPAPEKVDGPFEVVAAIMQSGKPTDQLQASRPAEIRVQLTVKKAADYVMLEVPIPAGCSYGAKRQAWRWSRQETHREYRREKVAIFCEHLEPGEYEYVIALEPRFTGRFQLNPAKAEQMYFPIFFGREGMKEVRIKE